MKFSAMEIYNESVRDLLSMDTTPLRLLDDPEVILVFCTVKTGYYTFSNAITVVNVNREGQLLRDSQRRL